MGTFSIWHWLIVLVVVLVLFGGRGKLSALMGDAGKGIRSFQKGPEDGDEAKDEEAADTKAIDQEAPAAAASSTKDDDDSNTKKAASG